MNLRKTMQKNSGYGTNLPFEQELPKAHQRDVIKVTAEVETTYEAKDIPMEQVKIALAKELAKKIINSSEMVFQQDFRAHNLTTCFSAGIKIVPYDVEHIMDTNEGYIFQGVEFNSKQIREALKNTFPELFL